jgi:hypothetical protein
MVIAMQIASNTGLLATLGQLTGVTTPASPVKSSAAVSVKAGDEPGKHLAAADQTQSSNKPTGARGQRGSLLNVVV